MEIWILLDEFLPLQNNLIVYIIEIGSEIYDLC
jgi:hypothetical protein